MRNISISHYQGQDFSVYVHYTQAKTGTGNSNPNVQSHVSERGQHTPKEDCLPPSPPKGDLIFLLLPGGTLLSEARKVSRILGWGFPMGKSND